MTYELIEGDCQNKLQETNLENISFYKSVNLSFVDPPFNQGKKYDVHDDSMNEERYWQWMQTILKKIFELTSVGGAIYFMQREKNAEFVLRSLRKAGWTFQNLIVWKKKTSAVPNEYRFGKHYQIIAFSTKGEKPRVFNKLRIDPPLPPNYKRKRKNGVYVTDVWTDVRELTSGYYAGEEPLREDNGERSHKQQSPVELLARIILSSTMPGDTVLDPFAGTGTTTVVSEQLDRNSISIEKDPNNISLIKKRLNEKREADLVSLARYKHTDNLNKLLGKNTQKEWLEETSEGKLF